MDVSFARLGRSLGCQKCLFWRDKGSGVGECRVSPPRTSTMRFPVVDPDEWCGSWNPVALTPMHNGLKEAA